VIVLDKVPPWVYGKALVWPVVSQSLESLLEDSNQIVIESAGIPTEINTQASDNIIMSVAGSAQPDQHGNAA
jgi:adenosylcobyric acid synthase